MNRSLAEKIKKGLVVEYYGGSEAECQIDNLAYVLAHVLSTLVEAGLMTKADCRSIVPGYVNLED